MNLDIARTNTQALADARTYTRTHPMHVDKIWNEGEMRKCTEQKEERAAEIYNKVLVSGDFVFVTQQCEK